MKPETEILAAYRQLADAQLKSQLAEKELARTRAAADQAQQRAGEARNYLERCESRITELAKADASEVIRTPVAQPAPIQPPSPAKPPGPPINPLPPQGTKRK